MLLRRLPLSALQPMRTTGPDSGVGLDRAVLVQVRDDLRLLTEAGADDPKLQQVQRVLRAHFKKMKAQGQTTRAMVFTSLKEGAEQMCTALNAMEGNVVIARYAHGLARGNGVSLEHQGVCSHTH